MRRHFPCIIFCLIICAVSCSAQPENKIADLKQNGPLIIDVIPLGNISKEMADHVHLCLKKIYPRVVLKEWLLFPENSYYKPRHRYRADSLIRYLSQITPSGHITVGITSKDISTTKGKFDDWGVMGLSYRPGNACVASCFRLHRKKLKEQFFKVVIHELGHSFGLDHCPNKSCYMQDAEGKNKADREREFCSQC